MPASSESLRSERWSTRRCSRMNSPSSRQRVSNSSFIPRSGTRSGYGQVRQLPKVTDLPEQGVDAGLALAVATGDLGLQRIDAVEERPAHRGDVVLEAL